jgi:hypothetical protein
MGSRGRFVAMPSHYGMLSAKVKPKKIQTDPLPMVWELAPYGLVGDNTLG